jgi:hypothetical protein
VLPDFLDGLATAKLDGDGSDSVKRSQQHVAHGALPNFNRKANVQFFMELGEAPLKYSTGEYHEQLRIASSNARVIESYSGSRLISMVVRDDQTADAPAGRLAVNGQSESFSLADDIYFQATTRGGRVIDYILHNKAVFKKTTSKVGDVALVTASRLALASAASGNKNAGLASAAILATALAFKGISAATTPTADTRCWDNLPQYLGLASLELPPGKHAVTIMFLDPSGGILARRTINIEVVGGNKDTVVFVSDR